MSMLVILVLFAIFTSVMPCGPGRGIGGPRRLRKLTPLVFKQHVPNVSENNINAAGLQEGKISRNHDKFKDLEANYNNDIDFKDDEGTGADRVMTQVSWWHPMTKINKNKYKHSKPRIEIWRKVSNKVERGRGRQKEDRKVSVYF